MIFLAIALGLVALSHIMPFPLLLDAAAPDRVIWEMPPQDEAPTIYLTYDDGPNPAATGALLDVLDEHDVRATFFLIDAHVTEETAPLVRRMFEDGHGVAVHSGSRVPMVLPPEEFASWVEGVADHIEALAGERPCRAFRPHAGWRSRTMLQGLDRIDYQLVGWGFGAWDFTWPRARTGPGLAQRILDRADDGLIVVMHDGHHIDPRADRDYAVEATALMVPRLKARGFRFGSVCDGLEAAPVGAVEPPAGDSPPDGPAGSRARGPR